MEPAQLFVKSIMEQREMCFFFDVLLRHRFEDSSLYLIISFRAIVKKE